MCDVAPYHVWTCTLFPVQGGMWTGYGLSPGLPDLNHSQSTYLTVLETTYTPIHDMLPHRI